MVKPTYDRSGRRTARMPVESSALEPLRHYKKR